MYAAELGLLDAALKLLEMKADVNAKDRRQQTPLIFAAKNGHRDICVALVEANADLNARDADGRSPGYFILTQGSGVAGSGRWGGY